MLTVGFNSNAERPPKHNQETKTEMETEMKAVRSELESTKKALKVQMARCRHLVGAFTRKLAERDEEVRASRELRDKQLSSVLRALLILEARLKREQKSIRIQLAEKDNIINNQQLEIEHLRACIEKEEEMHREELEEETRITGEKEVELFITDRECYAKPDLISSLGIDREKRLEEDSPTPSLRYEHPPDSLSSDTASTRSCLGDTSDSDFPSGPHSKAVLGVHNRSAFSPINKSFRSNQEVKTEFEEKNELFHEGEAKTVDPSVRNVKHLPSTLLQEVRIGTRSGDQDEYQDNPVLQCVNQILLKDQEDFLEEQRSLRMRGLDSGRPEREECPGWLPADCEDLPSPDERESEKRSPSPNKIAVLNNQEKTCLTMSNRLSIARIPDLDKTEGGKHQMNKKSVSMTDLSKVKLVSRPSPPLPPKPNRLSCIKRVEFVDKRRDIRPTTVEFHNPPMVLPPPQPVRIDTTEMDIINKQPSLPLSILDPMDQGPDNELYVISNSALDDDIVRHLQGRSMNGSGLDITLSPQRLGVDTMHTRSHHSNVPNGLLHPNHKPKNKGIPNNINLFSTSSTLFSTNLSPGKENNNTNGILKTSRAGDAKDHFPFKSPPKAGLVNAIKVASPVATLLTSGKAQESQVKTEVSPSVSQMVRRFEDLGTNKGSPCQEDGARTEEQNGEEKEQSEGDNPSVSYDNFLEATGLSQKSIMTPSRMLSNHKSVMKPKDVKHRSRVKAAAIVEKVIPPQLIGPTIKYWTEPYL